MSRGAARGARALRRTAVACAVLALVSGCAQGGDSLAEQARKGEQKGYVAGSGAVEAIPAGQRLAPVRLEGSLLDGSPWKLADAAGAVVVVNVWGSWCAPCEAEMPLLAKASKSLPATHRDVRFLGINVGESAQTGAAAATRYGLGYPSLSDPDRTLSLGLQGKASATPTTLVLDRQGRIAARVSGQVTSEAILAGLVADVAAES